MPEKFYEVYNLLIRDNNYPDFLICEKIEFETQENPGLVEFNYQTVMRYEDDSNMEVIGFFHTHPHNCAYMSQTDIDTMQAWIACFGRPLLCVIGCDLSIAQHIKCDSIIQDTSAWWCWKNIAIPTEVAEYNPDRYVFYPSHISRCSHLIVKNSHEDIKPF